MFEGLDDLAAAMKHVNTPEFQESLRKDRAAELTVASVLAEVAQWGAEVDERTVIDFVGLIALVVGQKAVKLFKSLREAISTDDMRDIADQEWARLRPGETEIAENIQYVFDNQEELDKAINFKCAKVRRGSSMEFVFRDCDGFPFFLKKRDAEIELAQYRLHVVVKKRKGKHEWEEGKELPGFPAWLKSPDRKEYKGVGFYPNESKTPDEYLNLWNGLAVKPAPGDWSLLRSHVLENVCQGNVVDFNYLMDWTSQLFFERDKKSGVIPVLRGAPGTGKSKYGEWVCKIVGKRHSLIIDKGKHLTGNFTGHLELKIFVLAEEAVFAGDPTAARALKHLATSEGFTYESKGVDAREGESYCRVLMTSDQDWTVPVDALDRRYFILDVAATHKEDKEYFAAIDQQMEAGGAAAMLHDLLERKMTFARMGRPPMTDAKKDQMRLSMSPQMKWLASVLTDGQFQYREKGEAISVDWPEKGGGVPKALILQSYREFVPGYRSPPTAEELGLFLRKAVPKIKSTKPTLLNQRVPHYHLPPVSEVRADFIRSNPGYAFEVVEETPDDAANVPANDAEPHRRAAG